MFSPDGKRLAYRAQKRAGFEADKWDVCVVDCKEDGTVASKPKNYTGAFDLSAEDYVWLKNEDLICAGNTFVPEADYPDAWLPNQVPCLWLFP